jgi:hypothetical protein
MARHFIFRDAAKIDRFFDCSGQVAASSALSP